MQVAPYPYNWTDQELFDFQAYQKILLDSQAREDQVYDEGKAEGKVEVVKNMLRQNFDVDTIFKVTGISQDEIIRLGNDL